MSSVSRRRVERGVGAHLDGDTGVGRASSEGIGRALDRFQDGLRLGLGAGRLTDIAAGEEQQLVGQRGQPHRLVRRVGDRVAELLFGASRAPRELELGLEHGDRGSQLVARVGDEVPLAPERALESPEHPVHGPREPGDLVATPRHVQARVRCRGRRSRRPGDASARRVGARRPPGTRRRSPRARRRSIRRRGTPAAPCPRRCWSPRATSRRPRSGCPFPRPRRSSPARRGAGSSPARGRARAR